MTKEDEKTLTCIKVFFMKNGRVPTIRELSKMLDIKSTNTVWWRLEKLADHGYIRKTGKTYTVVGAKISFDDIK